MQFYKEQSKNTKIYDSVDVLVVGSGPSGIAAALSSARSGAKTMLIEQLGNVGGMSTSGMMSHWTGSVQSKIYTEILTESARLNSGKHHDVITTTIDPEKLKTLYLDMLTSAGCSIRLYTFASDVIMEGDKLKGVIVESKSGREAIFANTIIDATGDGDIAAKSGAAHIIGREDDGNMQPVTIMFKVAGVDEEKAVFLGSFESTYQTERGELQELARKHLTFPAGHVLLYKTTLPGVVTCNMTNCIEIDGTNADDLTKGTITCRKQMDQIIEFLREFVPGYENCFIISSASLIGVRETRHFKGLYTLTEDDIYSAKAFEDWVVRNAKFNFDVHNLSGAGLDVTGVQEKFEQEKGYTIPYTCLVPEKIDGLLLCGRNISGTHMAHSNFRAMPICVAIGEAAGYAASIAAAENREVRDLEVKKIQAKLL